MLEKLELEKVTFFIRSDAFAKVAVIELSIVAAERNLIIACADSDTGKN